LLAFFLHALSKAGQAIFVVGLVQDQAPEINESQIFERGDHAANKGVAL